MEIYNTLARKKEVFEPRSGKKVQMFVCGPTVYDYSHIGHARTYIIYDVMARYLRQSGYEVFYLQNITDIDDKIIDRAIKSDKKPLELAQEFTTRYFEDMKALGINSVNKYAPAIEYIPQIINHVRRLLDGGYAYLIENDGYYFDLSKFSNYGRLSGRTTQAAEDAISRIDESINKRNRGDFCLWKFSKTGEPSWDTNLGKGRPGWHIEDTAITEKEFGPQYDLHGGALELIFPHHEAEIAQMEAISGQHPMVKYWAHSGVLTINGKKMAKSLGNFITIRDLLKNYSAEVIRFMALNAHYRSPLDFSDVILRQSEAAIQRISEFKRGLELAENDKGNKIIGLEKIEEDFFKNMDNDFNIPEAFGHLFDLIRQINPLLKTGLVNKEDRLLILEFINKINIVLGIIPSKEEKIPIEILKSAEKREGLRKEEKWNEADKIRTWIEKLGYKIEDTIYGPVVIKK